MSAIERAELELEGTVRKNPAKEFNKLLAFIRSHLDWTVDDNGIMHIERLQNSFSFDSNMARRFIIFTSIDTSCDKMMSSYDTRGWVEKAFDIYMTDTDGSPSRARDPDRVCTRFFIKMLTLIVHITIQNRLRGHEREIRHRRERGTTYADYQSTL